ncbi:MAG: thymidine phosphorylase [Candidatus Poseidoniaceae archaeon]|jgi:pyrimidine-nucleoside phosphorylase|nr:thymidine phosphorylase [Candidatus Poseidoniaceae archaeon]
MLIPNIIETKRDGLVLTNEQMKHFIEEVAAGNIPNEQIGAWLMAVFQNGMTMDELTEFTRLMRDSGEVIDWGVDKNLYVDKHSTGGVGDKMSLVLAPALAACGLKVPMISGRGLAHTGGTIDKLESIPGFNSDGGEQEIRAAIESAGCCIYAQSQRIAPADGVLYAIRDVTATVPSIPLITASIISKKSAEGVENLVLDIKVGSAAFMQHIEEARELAHSMIEVGKGLGMNVRVLLTQMDLPIGTHIGNSHEVIEIIDILDGTGSWDSISLIAIQGAHLLQMSGLVESVEQGQMRVLETLSNGSAAAHFRSMCAAQGVSQQVLNDISSHIDFAPYSFTLHSATDGWVENIDAMELSKVLCELGAGRVSAEDDIDHGVGAVINSEIGKQVKEGDLILTVHHREEELDEYQMQRLESCIGISHSPVSIHERLIEVIE